MRAYMWPTIDVPITPVPIQPILVVPGLTSATVALIFEFVDSDRCFIVKKREEETTLGGVFNTALVRLIKRRRVVARSITEIKKNVSNFSTFQEVLSGGFLLIKFKSVTEFL